ncbi:NUDIX hydrolase [Kiloniella majae]|uniref:NUDIX hydrolase n=1 Tax=Kiloniella majae TaxID=1938558 RepID=UPI000A277196|nr:hypothetical protein [Kiloniella majae]
MNASTEPTNGQVIIGLNAVIVAIIEEQPKVLVVQHTSETLTAQHETLTERTALPHDNRHEALPFGPFYPLKHRTLEAGLRSWVEEQTDHDIGYVEQLYTFGNEGRDPREEAGGARLVSVGYLALVQDTGPTAIENAVWQDWYRFFPWEDWRDGTPTILESDIIPALRKWIEDAQNNDEQKDRYERTCITFGLDDTPWNDELVLERYELLYEASLVAERQDSLSEGEISDHRGTAMALDHRRILATAIGRLRGKIKYRPVVFELMPPTFTLLQLQKVVEALSGSLVHKQNFRRLIEKKGLVEATGKIESQTGGRPANQFRFRREVLMERQALGVRQN